MRVVFDTNVLVSAFLFPGGKPEAVYRLAVEGRIELVTSPAILAEFARVLGLKFGRDHLAIADAVAQISIVAVVTRPTEQVEVVEADPDDNRILEAAAAGEADVIVSGDRHLLRLGSWEGMLIESPAEFLEKFQ